MSIKFRTVNGGSQAITKYFHSYSFIVPKHCVNVCSSSRTKLNTFPKRHLHRSTSSTRRFLPILSVVGGRSITLAVPHSFVSRNRACGLHTTCQRADALPYSGSYVAASEYMIDSAANNIATSTADGNVIASNNVIDLPLSVDSGSIQDIFASGAGDTLSSVGLGGYTPVGLIQHVLDFGHVSLGLPWWGSIVCCTVLFRLLVFPLVLKSQINSAKMNAIAPELERIQLKMREVQNLQNPTASAEVAAEMQELYKKHEINPAKMLIAPLVQMPLFISFFLGLRKMAELPIESMKTGGVLWFPDLTAADPFFILPFFCAGSMLLTLELGGEAGMQTEQMKKMKNVFRGMCVLMLVFTHSFPTAIFTYWSTSNLFSLGQILLLKQSSVQKKLGIPPRVHHVPNPDIQKGSWIENVKAGYQNAIQAGHAKQAEKMEEEKYEESTKKVHKRAYNRNPRLKQNEELFRKGKRRRKSGR